MTTTLKAASTFAAAGTAAAGGVYFGTDIFKEKNTVTKRTIASLLREKHPQKRLISSDSISDPDWRKAYKLYREENKDRDKGQDTWKLDSWTRPSEVSQEVDATSEFISKCNSSKLLEVSGELDSLYQQVLKYCTRDTLVKDLISESSGKRLLSSSEGQDAEAWSKVWDAYKTQNNVDGKGKDVWEFSDWSEKKSGTDLPKDFKTKCDEKAKLPTFTLENENYRNVLSWCTTDK
ncbi:hypothetical protein HF1_02910 [Mycoplasma haemofelis str. Langford 1]|uniref:Uncharacterized protein n=1 Tax=Mycoplasma haemofelis (strain Langford 1) TaxID=941640 RepID=E8ZGM8_MYCHL|nr:hypothetical protein [Mycoplasma haemofelis]CBY92299.1 hypothetical protein HF1_02910 [Mycoplasma haemofelis str. Langford 1]